MGTIRELRKRLGLPVDALAHKAGVSTRHIVLWERYGLPPRSRATLEKIARVLGVEPDDLLRETENAKGVTPEELLEYGDDQLPSRIAEYQRIEQRTV